MRRKKKIKLGGSITLGKKSLDHSGAHFRRSEGMPGGREREESMSRKWTVSRSMEGRSVSGSAQSPTSFTKQIFWGSEKFLNTLCETALECFRKPIIFFFFFKIWGFSFIKMISHSTDFVAHLLFSSQVTTSGFSLLL